MEKTDITYESANKITNEQLYHIAKIDTEIPLKFNSNHDASEEQTLNRIEYYKDLLNDGFFKIAFSNNETIGFHAIHRRENKTANIATLWVHPSFRKKGIAKKLKEFGIDWAKAQNIEFITTSVHMMNERMVNINKDAGYEIVSVNMRLKIN